MEYRRVAVVGSGISGLSAAWLLHRWVHFVGGRAGHGSVLSLPPNRTTLQVAGGAGAAGSSHAMHGRPPAAAALGFPVISGVCLPPPAAAHRRALLAGCAACRQGARVTLYESEESCGGHTLTDTSSGYPVDLGFQVSNKKKRGCWALPFFPINTG